MTREGRWEVHDGTASEIEMTDFLYGLVRMLKPKLIVETGTYRGHTAMFMAEACLENSFGKVVSCDIENHNVFNPLPDLCDLRISSSLDLPELRTADLVYSDSLVPLRPKEYELVKPGCVFVVHDTNNADDWTTKLRDWVEAKGGLTFSAGRGFGILVKP